MILSLSSYFMFRLKIQMILFNYVQFSNIFISYEVFCLLTSWFVHQIFLCKKDENEISKKLIAIKNDFLHNYKMNTL